MMKTATAIGQGFDQGYESTPSRQPDVHSAMDSLYNTVGRLEGQVEALISRLAMVTRNEPSNNKDVPECEPPRQCELSASIFNAARRLGRVEDVVEKQIALLEI